MSRHSLLAAMLAAMQPLPARVDLAIVGAGTAGAAAATFAARRGLRVLCLDRRPLEQAGARWINGVPAWVFAALDLEAPSPPERVGAGQPFHLVAGYEGPRVVIRDHQVLALDMRALVARLQAEAFAAGATLVGELAVEAIEGRRLETKRGAVECTWIVDASGLAGLDLLDSPTLDRRDLCAAAQEVRRCDPEGARAYLARHRVAEGDTLCFSGIAGGYSILNLDAHDDRVSLLTGTIPADSGISGRQLLDEFVAAQTWIGALEFGGARAIPVRRSHDILARGAFAAIGDAGCQVFPAHGSGIAPQLWAAKILADNLAAGAGVQGYAVEFQRRVGGLLASYDLFRRFSRDLSTRELADLFEAGLMSEAASRAGIEQRMPSLPTPTELLALVRGLRRVPNLARRLLAVAAKMVAVEGLYARYPRSPARLDRWQRAVARVFGG